MYRDKIIICSLVAVVLILILFAIFTTKIETSNSNNLYNNGICQECGGNYEFLQVVGHYASTCYVYKCNNCQNLIETNTYFKNN